MRGRTPSFKVLAPLGSGGMGDVYLALMEDAGREERVALKRLRGATLSEPQHRAQFLREAEISSALRHDNVVGLRAFGYDAHGPFLALELVDGRSAGTLLEAWEPRGALPLRALLAIARDVVVGLQFVHALKWGDVAGVVHRDVSPDNVLVSYDGIAKLADFGIARPLGAGLTHGNSAGHIKGKVGYIAPELFEGHPATTRSDYFSLAATLFRLSCGVAPFRGRTEAELLRSVLVAAPPRLEVFRRDVPPGFASWIHQALQQRPASRPSSLTPLRQAIEDALGDALGDALAEARAELASVMAQAFPSSLVSAAPSAPTSAPGSPGHALRGARATRTAQRLTAPAAGAGRGTWLASRLAVVALAALAALVVTDRERGWSLAAVRGPTTDARAPRVAPAAPPLVATTGVDSTPGAPAPAAPPAPVIERAPSSRPVSSRPGRPKGAAPRGRGRVEIRVQPWARVIINGKDHGLTPLPELELPSGEHRVVLINESLRVRRSVRLVVKANQTQQLRVSLP